MEQVEAENHRLRKELEELKLRVEEEKIESQRKTKALEDEIAELKKQRAEALENDDISSSSSSCSQRSQGMVEVSSVRSSVIKSLKKTTSLDYVTSGNQKQVEATTADFKREVAESERHSRCDSEELADSVITTRSSRAPRVPKPPPRPSFSLPHSTDSAASENKDNVETDQAIPQPPKLAPPAPPPPPPKAASKAAPPPPPPPPKGTGQVAAKVRRIPEVVEFYHSLMRRESQSRRESISGTAEIPTTAKPRDMIGEIENRSSHLLAVSVSLGFAEISVMPLVICVNVQCLLTHMLYF